MYILVLQRLLIEALIDLAYFPLWWYSGGLVRVAKASWELFRDGNQTLAPALWFKNLFVPMYGQYDWQGKVISFFVRLIQASVRSVMLFFWFVGCMSIVCVWLIIPIVVTFGLLMSLVGFFTKGGSYAI